MSDPYRILGVPPTADDEAVRHAYLEAIRLCPPERDARRFEAIRAAYESVRDARSRLKQALFDHQAPTPDAVLEALVGPLPRRRPTLARLLKFLEQS
ncbi:MAG: J domain-containing protein [Methylotetracoccus sp.]|jgi:curved DNA-binding protein CbpA|nr:J domain-containing protein [Methylotetracoccus sp.]